MAFTTVVSVLLIGTQHFAMAKMLDTDKTNSMNGMSGMGNSSCMLNLEGIDDEMNSMEGMSGMAALTGMSGMSGISCGTETMSGMAALTGMNGMSGITCTKNTPSKADMDRNTKEVLEGTDNMISMASMSEEVMAIHPCMKPHEPVEAYSTTDEDNMSNINSHWTPPSY